MPGMTSVPRKGRRDFELTNCLNEAGTDCGTIEMPSSHGVHHPGAFNGRRLLNGSLSPTTQRRRRGHRPDDRGGIRTEPEGANHGAAPEIGESGIPSPTGPASVDTQG